MSFDLSAFRDFPPHLAVFAHPGLSINGKGQFVMNSAFRQQTGRARDFRGMYSEDGRQLLLFPHERPNVHFSQSSGVATNRPLAEILRSLGYGFPLRYRMAWDEGCQAWVGDCQEMAPPPVMALAGRSKRRKGARS